ncbi:MAG: hypothetical protein IPL16_04105 [Ignavibacteria bacterium]|nr:hypothetical protein [Ignavibacteria bacterium]
MGGVKKINSTLNKWGTYLMSFDNENRKSYILRSEYSNLYSQTYFSEVITYKPFGGTPTCPEENPNSSVTGAYFECKDKRYLQVATFQNIEPNTKFFMIVNRRCSPFIDTTSDDNNGGRRFVKIKLHSGSSSFAGFNNWNIYNVENDSLIKTFDKNTLADINLGWFLPGEGKLYKLAPVMQEGGTLVADEEVSGDFDCKGEVNNNGKNITLKPATTIYFSNINARIKMNGGEFKSGYSTGDNSAPVNLKGKDGNFWKGLLLQNCSRVEILRTYFENVSPYRLDSTYALDMINCEFVNVSGSSFKSDNANNTGGIRGSYSVNNDRDFNTYISNNQFLMDAGNIPAVSIILTGGLVFPIIMEGNNFNSQNGNSLNAIFLNNISGGAIKNNNITGYKNGVIMLSSSLDFYGNIIDGSYDNSIGIQAFSESNVGLGNNGNYYLAGLNEISSEGANAKCIFVEKSYFDIYKAENIFDLKNYQAGQAYHLYGDFPSKPDNEPVEAFGNCFKVSGSNTNVIQIVKWFNGAPVNFEFEPYNCVIEKPEGKLVVDLGEGMVDTIYYESEGNGGGTRELGFKKDIMETGSMKSIMDSININIRKRNYEKVNTDCRTILNNYSDSLQSGGVISKLYLADLRLDSSGNRISELKSYLESLILNNNENELLIKQAFYYIQKCKVSLGDYASAMTGFQQIIDQNPYSYEGLVASWDYASASLLLNGQGGSGGGEKENFELGNAKENSKDNENFKMN